MNTWIALLKKESMEQLRSGKWTFLGILFVLFGIMNPAVAKLTPWLMEMMADSLAESGMLFTPVTITAMDSWVQFFKNIPMALIAFVLLEDSIFTKEYQSGTLVLSLTKGLPRHQVVLSKAAMLAAVWTAGYWLCFGITYGYNAYFWDNAVAQNLPFSVVCWWMFGLWVLSLMVLFSTIASANTGVLLGTGGVVLASSLLGLVPKVSKYLPTLLTDGNGLIYGTTAPERYTESLVVTGILMVVCFIAAIPLLHQKSL